MMKLLVPALALAVALPAGWSAREQAAARGGAMKRVRCAVLDDYQDVATRLADWSRTAPDNKSYVNHIGRID